MLLVYVLVGSMIIANVQTTNGPLDNNVEISNVRMMRPSDLTPHDPIGIESDEGFSLNPGWTGSGTVSDPYVLDGYNISLPVRISNTRAYFVIRNCEISYDTEYPQGEVALSNVTNGVFEDSVVKTDMTSVFQVNNTAFRNVTFVRGGIAAYDSHDISVENSTFNKPPFAISAFGVSNWTLDHNMISDSWSGVSIHRSINCSFSFNNITNAPFDVADNDLSTFSFEGNIINGKPLGYFTDTFSLDIDTDEYGQVIVYNCFDVKISGGTKTSATPVISIVDSYDIEISNVWIYDSRKGVFLLNAPRVNIHDNIFQQSYVGIRASSSPDLKISGNNFTENMVNIQADFSSCQIIDNTFLQTIDQGVTLYSCIDSFISRNSFITHNPLVSSGAFSAIQLIAGINITIQENLINCSFESGLEIRSVTNSTISSNIISRTNHGIYIVFSEYYLVQNNTIHNNTIGMWLYFLNSSLVIENMVYYNDIGILLDGPTTNIRLYSNWITLNNESDAIDNGDDNYWDDGVDTGNFWGNYTGPGPYLVPGSAESVDHYPQRSDIDGDGISDADEIELGRDPLIPEPTLSVITLIVGAAVIGVIVVVVIVLRSRFKAS